MADLAMRLIRYLLPILILGTPAVADELVSDSIDSVDTVLKTQRTYTKAQPLKRNPPTYPGLELRKGKEAWVQLSYCIDESGTPKNIVVVNSVGGERFERNAVKALEEWQYEPAVLDGKPSWQSNNATYINFAIEGRTGASRTFIRKFRKLGELITDGDIEKADALFDELYNDDLSLYELSKLWAQRVRLESSRGDPYKLHMALSRATASKGKWIEKNSFLQLLVTRIQVEAHMANLRQALSSYALLVDEAGEKSEEAQALKPLIEEIEAIIASDEPVKVSAEIRAKNECSYCDDSWYFQPFRNRFSFANVDGQLSTIDMRCDHKRYEAKAAPDVEWKIPDAWGSCGVQVYGEPGTTMDVIFLPPG